MACVPGAVLAAAMLWPVEAHAQRHAVRRAPARTTVHVGVGVGGYYRPYYYRPYYSRAYYYRPYYYGYGGWPYYPSFPYGWGFGLSVGYGYGHAYGWPAPYGYYYGPSYYGSSSSLRIQVEPKEAEVFVDGYWAGTVDDFDGTFQRLHLEPGEHELELYLEGHRSIRQKIYVQPGATFRVRHTMVPLAPGDTPDPRPTPPAGPQRGRYDAFGRPQPGDAPPDRMAPEPRPPAERAARGALGTLAVRVQPRDAEVVIDGERWDAPEGAERLVVDLPEGEHRVEVRKDGFEAYASTVRVRRGETTAVNVSLSRE
jgi:hypothetical protein